jgi:archaellum component FlaC
MNPNGIPIEVLLASLVTVICGMIGWAIKSSIMGLISTIKDLTKEVHALRNDMNLISQIIKEHGKQLENHDDDIKDLMKNYGASNGNHRGKAN